MRSLGIHVPDPPVVVWSRKPQSAWAPDIADMPGEEPALGLLAMSPTRRAAPPLLLLLLLLILNLPLPLSAHVLRVHRFRKVGHSRARLWMRLCRGHWLVLVPRPPFARG